MSTPPEPTQLLIAADRASDMKVLTRDGAGLGSVHTFMMNKRTGQATHAVLVLGGFLGMGKSYYPLPFELMTYDPTADQYRITIDQKMIEGGPSWSSNTPVFDQAYSDRVAGYYGVAPQNLSLAM